MHSGPFLLVFSVFPHSAQDDPWDGVLHGIYHMPCQIIHESASLAVYAGSPTIPQAKCRLSSRCPHLTNLGPFVSPLQISHHKQAEAHVPLKTKTQSHFHVWPKPNAPKVVLAAV